MIGIFDSGIGGLTTVKALLERVPQASFIYLGDTARTPYGNKTAEKISTYALEDAAFLIEKGATSLIVACNSVSAVAMPHLRKMYPRIPMYEVIQPAVDEVIAYGAKRVGVIGTRATIASGLYEQRLKEKDSCMYVQSQACPLFVPLVEEGCFEARETKQIARKYLSRFRSQSFDALILGCTHYPLLRNVIQRAVGKKVRLIDSGSTVIDSMLASHVLEEGRGEQQFYFTDLSTHSVAIARLWLDRSIQIQKAEIGK